MDKKITLVCLFLATIVFLSGCIYTPEEPPIGGEELEEIETQEEASEAVTEIGTAMNSLIAELEGIDEEIE